MAIFAAFGYGGAMGLSYTLVRRLREGTWAAAGLLALASLSARPAPVDTPEVDVDGPRPAPPRCARLVTAAPNDEILRSAWERCGWPSWGWATARRPSSRACTITATRRTTDSFPASCGRAWVLTT